MRLAFDRLAASILVLISLVSALLGDFEVATIMAGCSIAYSILSLKE